jgi:hypothetical protein
MYEECRIEWVSGYLDIKPNIKGNACTQAFKRFKTRLSEKYGHRDIKSQSQTIRLLLKKQKRERTKKPKC